MSFSLRRLGDRFNIFIRIAVCVVVVVFATRFGVIIIILNNAVMWSNELLQMCAAFNTTGQ